MRLLSITHDRTAAFNAAREDFLYSFKWPPMAARFESRAASALAVGRGPGVNSDQPLAGRRQILVRTDGTRRATLAELTP